MDKYKAYLIESGFSPRTVSYYASAARRLLKYLELIHRDIDSVEVEELYDFTDHLRENGLNDRGAIHSARSLRHYFNFLGWQTNPALMLQFKRRETTLVGKTLDEYELADLFLSIHAKTPIQKRDQVMVGLVIFQAVRKEELALIELEDIDLQNRTITIPGARKTNERILKLDVAQTASVEHYLYDIRPELLKMSQKDDSPYLFFSQGTGDGLNNCIQRILKKLKVYNPSFKSITHIRNSRIAFWIKTYDLPTVQYLSGMRYLSSLERYYEKNTEELKRKLQVFHPLKG